LADDLRAEFVGGGLQRRDVVDGEEGVVGLAEADLRALQLLLDEAVPVEVVGGLERKERGDPHHHRAQGFVAEVDMSAAGPPSKSTTPFSPLSTSPTAPTASTNFATTCASSKATVCCSGMAPATPTASPPKGFRLRFSFCSSTNGSAARSPTAASITAPTPITLPPASSKPLTTAPTKPSNRSSICWLPDPGLAIVELFLSTILGARIYSTDRRSPRRLTLSVRLLNSFCLRFSGLESS